MEDTDKLCKACELVNLYSLFTGPRNLYIRDEIVPAVGLGTLKEIKANTHCPLCRLLRQILYGANDNIHPWKNRRPNSLQDDEEYEPAKVRCTLRPVIATEFEDTIFRDEAIDELVATALLIVLEAMPNCVEAERRKISGFRRDGGHIKLLSPGSVDPSRPLLNGFPSTTLENSLSLLSKWLATCHEHHASTCHRRDVSQQMLAKLSLIRTIDVSTRKLVKVNPSTTKYATLSWTWGQGKEAYLKLSDELVVSCVDSGEGSIQSLSLPAHGVPLVIEDAIFICRFLNIPYLWVDVYCIDQKDSSKTSSEIGMMGFIYRLSHITFVTGGKSLLEHRSLSTKTDTVNAQPLRTETIQGRQYISAYFNSVTDTSWSKRGWTYQEGQLATRIAYFNQNELTFFCGAGPRRESLHSGVYGHEIQIPGLDLSSSGIHILAAYDWFSSSDWAFFQYVSICWAYSSRLLTYESDRLDAIQGCLNLIAEHGNAEFFQGLPLVDFHYALLFGQQDDRRRHGFPSWSWAGWYTQYLEHYMRPHESGHRLLVSEADGQPFFTGGHMPNRKLSDFLSTREPSLCSQYLARISISKSASTITVQSEVAKFTCTAYKPSLNELQLRDVYGTIFDFALGSHLKGHFPIRNIQAGTEARLLRDGIELIMIFHARLVEGPSSFALGPGGQLVKLDHVFCLGINRSCDVPGCVERWGSFIIPMQMWEEAGLVRKTVTFC